MRVDIDSLLSSIWAFATDLKRIQTPQRFVSGFGADKTLTTLWSGCREFEIQFEPLPVVWLSLPKAILEDNWKVLTAKSTAELLGQHSGTAWAGWTGKHKHRVFPCLLQSLQAVTASLQEKVLPLLLY